MHRLYMFIALVLCNWRSALGAESAGHLSAAFRAFLGLVGWDGRTALRTELASGLGTALRAFLGCLGGRSRCAAFGAELAHDGCTAFRAGNTGLGHSRTINRLCIRVILLLRLARSAIPSVLHHATRHAACAGIHHAEADKGVASTTRVVGCIAHDIDDLTLLHHRVGAVFVTVDLGLAGVVE